MPNNGPDQSIAAQEWLNPEHAWGEHESTMRAQNFTTPATLKNLYNWYYDKCRDAQYQDIEREIKDFLSDETDPAKCIALRGFNHYKNLSINYGIVIRQNNNVEYMRGIVIIALWWWAANDNNPVISSSIEHRQAAFVRALAYSKRMHNFEHRHTDECVTNCVHIHTEDCIEFTCGHSHTDECALDCGIDWGFDDGDYIDKPACVVGFVHSFSAYISGHPANVFLDDVKWLITEMIQVSLMILYDKSQDKKDFYDILNDEERHNQLPSVRSATKIIAENLLFNRFGDVIVTGDRTCKLIKGVLENIQYIPLPTPEHLSLSADELIIGDNISEQQYKLLNAYRNYEQNNFTPLNLQQHINNPLADQNFIEFVIRMKDRQREIIRNHAEYLPPARPLLFRRDASYRYRTYAEIVAHAEIVLREAEAVSARRAEAAEDAARALANLFR